MHSATTLTLACVEQHEDDDDVKTKEEGAWQVMGPAIPQC